MIQVSKLRANLWMPEDLAEYLNVPVGWIYKRTRKSGTDMIPHVKLGKYLRFDPESAAFKEWLAFHEVSTDCGESLTSQFAVNRVRATEKTGQVG